jgi:hypothetical protein
VRIDGGVEEKILREKLVAEARKLGLEYAILFRALPGGTPVACKVFVKDGREEMVSHVDLPMASWKGLKKILGAGRQYAACNLEDMYGGPEMGPMAGMYRDSFLAREGGYGGGSVSLIVPDALLLSDVELVPEEVFKRKVVEFVSEPD